LRVVYWEEGICYQGICWSEHLSIYIDYWFNIDLRLESFICWSIESSRSYVETTDRGLLLIRLMFLLFFLYRFGWKKRWIFPLFVRNLVFCFIIFCLFIFLSQFGLFNFFIWYVKHWCFPIASNIFTLNSSVKALIFVRAKRHYSSFICCKSSLIQLRQLLVKLRISLLYFFFICVNILELSWEIR